MNSRRLFLIRSIQTIAVLVFVLFSFSCGMQGSLYSGQEQDDVSTQLFYDQLSPYGMWIDYPGYGYVWVPDVDANFEPYATDGHWIYTNYGWTWLSDYPWGWAGFHYGRWDYNGRYGWFWIPDTVWGPAWVTWRYANGYYGWTPLRPGSNFDYYRNTDYWCFVPEREFGKPDIQRHYARRAETANLLNNSKTIDNRQVDRRRNTTYIAGPSKESIQNATGRRVNTAIIQDSNRPEQVVNNNQVRIFRPQINERTRTGVQPTPRQVTDGKDVKPPQERVTRRSNPDNNQQQLQQQNQQEQRLRQQEENNQRKKSETRRRK